jgi:uncharacterized membrane protein HdeD (DUF308 family)
MKYLLGRASLLFLISGITCLIDGVAIGIWTDINFHTYAYLFAVPVIVQGSMQFIYGINNIREYIGQIVLYLGIINIAVAYLLIFYQLTEVVLIITIGLTWTVTGIALLFLVFSLIKQMHRDYWLLLSGIFSLAVGLYVFIHFERNIVSLLWVTVVYNLLFGLANIFFGLRARSWVHVYFDDIMD